MDRLVHLDDHVRCCISGDWAVFLDLKRNRYWAAPACALADAEGAPVVNDGALTSFRATAPLLAELSASGMIAESPQGGAKDGSGACLGKGPGGALPWPAWLDCLFAWIWAGRQVRDGRLDRTMAMLSHAKCGQHGPLHARRHSVDQLYTYYEARRIWFPARFVCLFDSLAFVMFAARRGVCVDLVFGVRGRPFSAHCWVASDGRVINDAQEYCAAFTPILRA